ncbi:unnamed protein product [Brachionus calyciflorus]|uniref:Transmembrane protein n=1 Tax=Brachionus calyciflorus TaxID=104777 RepID=A0A814BG13_9BILA|nr:unnamed protein product [Brachionus calyciflorus]
MKQLNLVVLLAFFFSNLDQFECVEKCKYYPSSKSGPESHTTCSEICCSTSYPTSISSACCKKNSNELWWIAVPVMTLVIFLFGFIIFCVWICYLQPQSRVITPIPTITKNQLKIHRKYETLDQPNQDLKYKNLMANNINQQTLDSFQGFASIQPIFNIDNFDPAIPVLPNSSVPSYNLY